MTGSIGNEIEKGKLKLSKQRNVFILILAAFIWGTAFVAQSTGGDAAGPYTFNSIRMLIGGTVLLPVTAFLDRKKPSGKKPRTKEEKKTLLIGGCCCGCVLFAASTLQQLGLYLGSTAGKAGFLTTCYIVLVPVLGLFLKKKCGWNVWFGVVLTLAGLYLLCMKGSFSLRFCDVLILLCALCFAVHILVIDRFAPLVDGVRMSCIQFYVCGILGLVPMIFSEVGFSAAGFREWIFLFSSADVWAALLYAGVLSSGVAYTLQIVGQEGLNPTVASLVMSLESVFSVLAGWIILKEAMTGREITGCALIFAAVVLAQINFKKKIQKKP